MHRPIALALLLTGCASGAPPREAAPTPLTLDHIYGETSILPRLPALEWRPGGHTLTWLDGENLLEWDPDTGIRRSIFDFASIATSGAAGVAPRPIGRAAPGRFFWSPDGRRLLLHHAGDLWLHDDGKPRRLTGGREMILDPRWSPDSTQLTMVIRHDLYHWSKSRGHTRLTEGGSDTVLNGELDWVYPEELGLTSASWWSPDSRRIAFLQLDQSAVPEFPLLKWNEPAARVAPMRYPKAGDPNPRVMVGITGPGLPTTWADLGGDPDIYIARVDWLDGEHLALQRLDRLQTRLDVLLVEASTGRSRVLITETDPCWINVSNDLQPVTGGFLWTTESDGWRHLQVVDLEGRRRALTSGSWEVTRVIGVDRAWVYFESTEGDFLQRHAWRVSLEGGARQRLTSAPGLHRVELSGDGLRLLDTWSSAAQPPRIDILDADGTPSASFDAGPAPDLAPFHLPAPEFLTVAAEGLELPAMVIRPPDFNPSRRHPVLVHTYGGPGAQLVANRWGGANLLWHALLAQRGYVVFTLDNRGSGGRGRDWRRLVHRRLGELELRDQLHGVDWLRRQPWVEPSRIGIWGWSYGGTMVCNALTASDAFRAGVAVAPVTDWRLYDTIYTERYMMRPRDNPEGYRDTAPAGRAARLSGRLLLAHGLDDDNVHFQNTVVFAEGLVAAGRPFDLMIYPGKAHGISGRAARIHLFSTMLEFLERNL